jgi:hypothetical protein
VLGEPVELAARGLGHGQRLPERGREAAQHPDLGPGGRGVPAGVTPIHTERGRLTWSRQLTRVLGQGALGGRALRFSDHVVDLPGPHAGP